MMKKQYQAPLAEVEVYKLDASIASNCFTVVKHGMEDCVDAWDTFASRKLEGPYNINFEEKDNCDCYTTGGNQGYWQS